MLQYVNLRLLDAVIVVGAAPRREQLVVKRRLHLRKLHRERAYLLRHAIALRCGRNGSAVLNEPRREQGAIWHTLCPLFTVYYALHRASAPCRPAEQTARACPAAAARGEDEERVRGGGAQSERMVKAAGRRAQGEGR